MFNSGFSEAKLTSVQDPLPTDKHSSTSEYDYQSDSDLEDEAEAIPSGRFDDQVHQVNPSARVIFFVAHANYLPPNTRL